MVSPFLTYVINHLLYEGIEQFIFSLGYKSEPIIEFLNQDFPGLKYKTSIEDEPLGTGGAVKKSLEIAEHETVLVTNGDTLFKIDLLDLEDVHIAGNADCTLSLKPMNNFSRYGVVEIDGVGEIMSFKEKQFYESGLINGGVYLIDKNHFLKEDFPEKFSFESEYLEKFYRTRRMFGMKQDKYFIDIGIPEDFARAQVELSL